MKKRIIIVVVIIFGGIGGFFIIRNLNDDQPVVRTQSETPGQAPAPASPQNQLADVEVETLKHPLDEPDSLWVLVNKSNPISLDYVPAPLRLPQVAGRTDKTVAELSLRNDAAGALEELFAAAEAQGRPLLLGSAYRDAELQNFYYTNYVAAYGQAEADKFSARPGTSEHQTGLAADVSPISQNCYLETCFADTPEGIWVAQNAHKYGFIVRYPLGKEAITGYQFEPWHLRYVGVDLAAELFQTQQTMEEYFDSV